MKTILFTNVRDELRLNEWVTHHLNIGFDNIYIYDHNSYISVKHIINNEKVIIEEITNIGYKTKLIDKCVDYAKKNSYDWMIYLDADEFLVLPNDDNVVSFLNKYNAYDQICINWLMFGSNFHKEEPLGTMLETYTMCHFLLDQHVKSFVRPSKVINTLNAHVYNITNFSNSVGIDYINTNKENKHLHKCIYLNISSPTFLSSVNAFIAHYYTQSYETYYNRKIKYSPDDIACKNRKIYTEDEIYKLNNNVKFNFVCQKYNEINKIKL